MSKLTWEQKIEIYHKRKSGVTVIRLSKEYEINVENILYLIRLIDKHGEIVLRKDTNRYYSPPMKEEIINRVLIDYHSIKSTTIEYGLSSAGMLYNLINS